MSYGLYRRAYRAMVVPRLSLRWILTGCVVIGLLVVIALGDDVALGWGAPIVVLSLPGSGPFPRSSPGAPLAETHGLNR